MPVRLIPAVWVVIWAGSFVAAHVAAPHADPLTFLALRFAVSAALFVALARLAGARWPTARRTWRDVAIVGVLMHGIYLSCMFWAMWHGLPAGVAALVGGLQPLVTAATAAPLLGERVRAQQWLGIALGFLGVGIVVAPSLGRIAGFPPATVAVAFCGMLTFTAGTVWQKRIDGALDLRVGGAIQFIAATALTAPLALLFEDGKFDFSPAAWGAMAWFVLATSVGGTLLLLAMIARSALSRVATLLYLVPPTAALMAYVILGERLSALQLVGMAMSGLGVALARRPEPPRLPAARPG
jgi:drug/metabolite transporter (DMT)-like permease